MGWMMVTGAVHDAQAFLERYKRNISETFLVYFSFTRLYLSTIYDAAGSRI
jgi:hypothetical protein